MPGQGKPSQADLAAYHEAGHAVAVVARSGTLNSVHHHEHGGGLTKSTRWLFDDPFMTWAGPWSEARFLWPPDRDLDEETEEEYIFADYVFGVLQSQPSDRGVLDDYNETIDPAALAEFYEAWHDELVALWPAIQSVAERLRAGDTLDHADVHNAVALVLDPRLRLVRDPRLR